MGPLKFASSRSPRSGRELSKSHIPQQTFDDPLVVQANTVVHHMELYDEERQAGTGNRADPIRIQRLKEVAPRSSHVSTEIPLTHRHRLAAIQQT